MSRYFDVSWEAEAEKAGEVIRDEIADHLRNPAAEYRPALVEFVDYDGLDAVGNPLVAPAELNETQQTAHTVAVEALIAFLDCLDIDDQVLEKRVEDERDARASHVEDERRARRKAGDAA